jgi:histidinol-phosphatase (PHP family)
MLLDYHVHTTCSGDGHVPMEGMCARAVELGISEIAFTEHFDNNPLDMCCGTFHLDVYRSQIDDARRAFDGRLRVYTGIEFGEPYMYPDMIEEVNTWGLDVILGSMHWIGDTIVAVDEFADSDIDAVYRGYFAEVLKMVEFGGFDAMAHFDLVKRFGVKYAGPFHFARYRDRIAAILEVMVRQGIALEVNTSGLRQPCKETFPSLETLRLYRDLGGEMVSIGSDSHWLEQLGFGLREGMDLIRQAGFQAITVFEQRQPRFVSIAV